ncbi:MAG: RNA-binding protein [Myxococcota bacterium]
MGKRLYVGNLSYGSTEDTVRHAFEQDGRNVVDVHLSTDRDTGRPRGFGFVEMESDEQAQAAVTAMDGTELDGRNIHVSEARERPARPSGDKGHW